jgi:hypothetical protein
MKADKLGTLNSTNGELIHVFKNTEDFSLDHILSSDRATVVTELVMMCKVMVMAFACGNYEKLHPYHTYQHRVSILL